MEADDEVLLLSNALLVSKDRNHRRTVCRNKNGNWEMPPSLALFVDGSGWLLQSRIREANGMAEAMDDGRPARLLTDR